MCIALGIIEKVTSVDKMTDEKLCAYFDLEAEESKNVISIEMVQEMGQKKLKMNLDEKNTRLQMQKFCKLSLSLIAEKCQVVHRGR